MDKMLRLLMDRWVEDLYEAQSAIPEKRAEGCNARTIISDVLKDMEQLLEEEKRAGNR